MDQDHDNNDYKNPVSLTQIAQPEQIETEQPEQNVASRSEQEEEAIKRMKLMKVNPDIIQQFVEDGTVMVAEPYGWYRNLTTKEQDEISAFESEHQAVVFMVVNVGRYGTTVMSSILYVSQYPEEWKSDELDIKDGIVITYTVNRMDDFCSEFGSIGYETTNDGCIVRTC